MMTTTPFAPAMSLSSSVDDLLSFVQQLKQLWPAGCYVFHVVRIVIRAMGPAAVCLEHPRHLTQTLQ